MPYIHDHSTVFLKSRFASAFPGDRGIKWYGAHDAVKRLAIFLKYPLRFQTRNDREKFDFEHSPIGDPIWYFRELAALSIEEFQVLSDSKILIGFEEFEIKRIAVNIDRQYYKSYIYVEAKGEPPIGRKSYSDEDIKAQISAFGYASEQYAILGSHIISSQESDDGAAVINGEVIEAFDAEDRVRYLTDYNFIISAKQSPYNSPKFERETKDIFNNILNGTQQPEELFNLLSTYKKWER